MRHDDGDGAAAPGGQPRGGRVGAVVQLAGDLLHPAPWWTTATLGRPRSALLTVATETPAAWATCSIVERSIAGRGAWPPSAHSNDATDRPTTELPSGRHPYQGGLRPTRRDGSRPETQAAQMVGVRSGPGRRGRASSTSGPCPGRRGRGRTGRGRGSPWRGPARWRRCVAVARRRQPRLGVVGVRRRGRTTPHAVAGLDDVVDVHQLRPRLGEVLPRVGRRVERGVLVAPRPVVDAGVVGVERRAVVDPLVAEELRGTPPVARGRGATRVSHTKWPSSWRMWPSGVRYCSPRVARISSRRAGVGLVEVERDLPAAVADDRGVAVPTLQRYVKRRPEARPPTARPARELVQGPPLGATGTGPWSVAGVVAGVDEGAARAERRRPAARQLHAPRRPVGARRRGGHVEGGEGAVGADLEDDLRAAAHAAQRVEEHLVGRTSGTAGASRRAVWLRRARSHTGVETARDRWHCSSYDDGPVRVVTIDRPRAAQRRRRRHRRGPARRRSGTFDADDSASVAVLTGAGGAFCAGADLKALPEGDRRPVADDGPGPMGPTRLRLGKPVIAAIEGPAVAGGLELALWCDLRVAAADAVLGVYCRRFGVPLVDLGTIRLPRLIGHSRAIDLILTGRGVDGVEAERIGLVNRVRARRGRRWPPPWPRPRAGRAAAAVPAQRPPRRRSSSGTSPRTRRLRNEAVLGRATIDSGETPGRRRPLRRRRRPPRHATA